jgi:hypothetical protein
VAPIATLTVRLSAQIAEFQQQFQQATRATQQFQAGFQSTATKAAAIGSFFGVTAAAGVAKLSGELLKFVEQGQRLSAVERSFERLASSIRQNGDAMRGALREGTRGLVSDLDLLQSANKAILLGLPVTTQEMGELAKTATVLGKAMGQDATKSLDDLITALGRSSPLILDNLGLTVKVGEANEAYARKLGKTTSQLTDAEQKMAFYQAAMEAARQRVKDLGEETLTLGEIAQKVWTAVGNVITDAASTANNQIGKILTRTQDLIQFAKLMAATGSPGAALQFMQELDDAKARTAPKPDINLGDPAAKTTAQLKALQEQTDKGRRSLDAYRESVRDLAADLSGSKLRGEVKRLEDAWKSLTPAERASQVVMERTADAAMRLQEQGAALSGELFALVLSTGRFQASLPPVVSGMDGLEGEFQDVTKAIHDSSQQLIDFIGLMNDQRLKTKSGLTGLNLDDFADSINAAVIPPPPEDRFRAWRDAIGSISNALFRMAGDSQSSFARVARDIALTIDAFQRASQAAADYRAATTAGGRAGALAEGALAFWDATGAQGRGAATLGGAATGAQIGGAIVPGWGHVIGGIAGAITGWVRSGGQGREEVERFAESMGGFDALRKRLAELGDEGERLWKNLTQGVGSNNPEQAVAAINETIAALNEFGTEAERAQKRLDGLGQAVEGINAKAALFASPFAKLLEAQNAPDADLDAISRKLAAAAQAGQAEFERLGVFVGATFAGIVKETGDAIGALQSLAPAISVLQQGIEKFGLTSTATIDQLVSLFGLVNSETTGPILASIQATTQIFTGLQEAGHMTAELFQTVSDDIGASFRDLEAKGGDVAKAMALSQPILQKLWEAQQRYGAVTDETTAALLRQAEEQGLVGAHMQDVNEKILDVLIAIADVFGAVIPESMRRTEDAAANTAASIERNFKNVRINIPVDFDINQPTERELRPFNFSSGDGGGDLSASASVAGPESSDATFIMQVDGRTLAEATVPYIPGEVQRFGLA